jgi:hypothetical protein
MSLNFQQEEFSRAYVHAVATVAGFKVYPPATPDDDSVDLSIGTRGIFGKIRSPRIDIQLKCWQGAVDGETLSYALPVKNYEELRHEDYQVPRILVVVVVPVLLDEWITQSLNDLVLRRCGYWLSLRGELETANTTSVTVHIPVANVFSVSALSRLLENGEGA